MRNTSTIHEMTPVSRDRTTARERGFSMIEMILVIIIVGIIATVGAQLMGAGFQMYFAGRDTLDMDAQARLALERMTRELRTVRPATGLTMLPATEVTFTDVDGTAVRYYLSAGDLLRNTQVLAGGIGGLGFVYTNSSGAVTATPAQVLYISVQFTATQGSMSSTYRATVSPRNF